MNEEKAVKLARRAYRHIQIAWKLARECEVLVPGFFGESQGGAHRAVKPMTDYLNAIFRQAIKNILGVAE